MRTLSTRTLNAAIERECQMRTFLTLSLRACTYATIYYDFVGSVSDESGNRRGSNAHIHKATPSILESYHCYRNRRSRPFFRLVICQKSTNERHRPAARLWSYLSLRSTERRRCNRKETLGWSSALCAAVYLTRKPPIQFSSVYVACCVSSFMKYQNKKNNDLKLAIVQGHQLPDLFIFFGCCWVNQLGSIQDTVISKLSYLMDELESQAMCHRLRKNKSFIIL